MKKFTPENGSVGRVGHGSLWAALILLLTLTSWATMAAGGDQDNLVLDILPDFIPFIPINWDDNVIPSPDPFPDFEHGPLPEFLYGNAISHFAYAYTNIGDAESSDDFYHEFGIDESLIRISDFYPPPNGYYNWFTPGHYVGGGRHTIWQFSDPNNTIAEQNETNNAYARQWIWEPQVQAPNTQQLRAQPPERFAGTQYLPSGVPVYFNIDGVRLSSTGSGYWRGAAISTPDIDHDYDIYMYSPSDGVDLGFDNSYLTYSMAFGPDTDAVISNRNTAGYDQYDLGILNWSETSSDYRLEYRESPAPIIIGDTVTGTIDEHQVLELVELYIEDTQTGVITLDLQFDANQNVMLAAFDSGFEEGSIYDAAYHGQQEADGRVLIELNAPVEGYYGIAIWRHAYQGTDSFNYTLKVLPPLPDLAMVTLPGSYGPLIPRNNSDIIPGNPVPAPEILDGDVANTNFYWHLANLGSVSTQPFRMDFFHDGVTSAVLEWPHDSMPGDPSLIYSEYMGSFNIRGGRHTTGIMLDSQNSNIEITENNNIHAEQWVWNPIQLAPETSIPRAAPPSPHGGWDQVAEGIALYENVDGVRSQTFEQGPGPQDGFWGAVALLPQGQSEIYLSLYSPTTGPDNGFDIPLEQSNSFDYLPQFILIDFDWVHSWGQAWDVGALGFFSLGNYMLQSTRSLLINPDGLVLPSTFGAYGIAQDEVISLTEFSTFNTSDEVSFVLDIVHLDGEANFGVMVFERNDSSGFYNKFEFIAVNDMGGPGVDKSLELTLPGSSYFGLVVYKMRNYDYDKDLQYEVRFRNPELSSTPEEQTLPSDSKIERIYPNPFNPQTTIRLAMKQSGPASVKVYDVQGRLVRTLVEGELNAGRHDLRWTGVDNAGRSVPSGVYFVRAIHPDGVDQQRMSLVK